MAEHAALAGLGFDVIAMEGVPHALTGDILPQVAHLLGAGGEQMFDGENTGAKQPLLHG